MRPPIREFFAKSMAVREEQRLAGAIARELDAEATAAGVDPAVLATCRRIAAMREGKRGFHLFLLRRYLEVLEAELTDPTFSASTRRRPCAWRRDAHTLALWTTLRVAHKGPPPPP
jgi:hypothetical protein